ncbi:hypothetical protein OKW49_005307 [Paraburkholderia youngii]|uniref:hypothetical protein n=1 Tax=Paraburkholderia youngii TaxID=2782701 RepID=UPI003D196631
MSTVTNNICASMHLGRINPQTVIDRIEDRHKARLPEFGIDVDALLREAKIARRRDWIFAFLLLAPSAWAICNFAYNYDQHFKSLSADDYVSIFLGPLLLVTVITFIKELVVIRHIRSNLANNIIKSTDEFEGPNTCNVIISGGFSPFTGYGVDIEGWSFAIDASKRKDDSQPASKFGYVEFLNYVSSAVKNNIPSSAIDDKLFVNGQRIRENTLFLADPLAIPKTSIDPSLVTSKIGDLDKDIRHYRVVSIPLSRGELLLSFFIRSTMLGSNLFIESRSFLLLPVKQEFTPLDDLQTWRGARYKMNLLIKKFIISPISWFAGIISIVGIILKTFEKIKYDLVGHPEDKLKIRNAAYNYGNVMSLREAWAAGNVNNYFQMLDKDMAAKTCQYIVINSIVDFLDQKGIATDDIKERRTQIFNSGVIVSGGTVNTQQLAVGSGSAIKNTVAAMASKE